MAALEADKYADSYGIAYDIHAKIASNALGKIENSSDWLNVSSRVQSGSARDIVDSNQVRDSFDKTVVISTSNVVSNLAESGELSGNALLTSTIYLRQAASASNSENGSSEEFYSNISITVEIINFSKGFGNGVISAGEDIVSGFTQIVTDPIGTAEALGTAVVNYEETYNALSNAISEEWNRVPNYTTSDWGNLAGRIVGDLAATFTGSTALSATSKLIKTTAVNKKVSKLGKKIFKKKQSQLVNETSNIYKVIVGLVGKDRAREVFDTASLLGYLQSWP